VLIIPARLTIDKANCWLVAACLSIFLMSVSIDFLSCLKSALSYLHPEKELLEESDEVLDGADLVLSFLHSSIDGSPSNTGSAALTF